MIIHFRNYSSLKSTDTNNTLLNFQLIKFFLYICLTNNIYMKFLVYIIDYIEYSHAKFSHYYLRRELVKKNFNDK